MEKSPHPWTIHESLIRDAENLPIADVYGLKGDPIHEANARLIAASPMLLIACRIARDAIYEHGAAENHAAREALHHICAALALCEPVTGEST